MTAPYAFCNKTQEAIVTKAVIARDKVSRNVAAMLSKDRFLGEVERRAKSRAEIARHLKVAPPRVTEMYKGERGLSYEEAVTLAQAYGIEEEPISEEKLTTALALILRHQPKGGWTDREAASLAGEIRFLLSLLQDFDAKQASQDVLSLVERVLVDRLDGKSAPVAS